MTLLSKSLFFFWLVPFFHKIAECWYRSWIHHLGSSFCQFFRRLWLGSGIASFFRRDGLLVRKWDSCLFCFLFDAILNFLPDALRRGSDSGTLLRTGSVSGFLSFCRRKYEYLCGLFLFVLLVVPHNYWNNLYAFLGAMALFLLYFLSGLAGEDNRYNVRAFGVYLSFYSIFLVYALVASVASSLSFRFFFFHATCLLLCLCFVSGIRTLRQLITVASFAMGGLLISSLYGVYQGIVGVAVDASQVDLTLELNANMPGRIYSLFDNPNNYAEILVLLIPLCFACFLFSKGFFSKCFFGGTFLVSVLAIGMTYSRSGWLGLCLAACIFVALVNWKLLPVIAACGILLLPFLPSTIWNRILTIGNMNDSSTLYRFGIYQTLMPLWKDYFFTGVGLGSDVVVKVIETYPTQLSNGVYPLHAHNNYLQLWLENGPGGLLAFLGAVLFSMKQGVKRIKRSPSFALKCIIAACCAGLCGLLLIGVAEYTWYYPRVMILFWFLLSLLMSALRVTEDFSPSKK